MDLRSRPVVVALLFLTTIIFGLVLKPNIVPSIGAAFSPQQVSDVRCLSPSPADLSQTLFEPSSTNGTAPANIAPDIRHHTATYLANMPPASRLQVEFVFKLRNADQFQQCLNSISDPSSPEYLHFLNMTTLQPYLPTPGQRASVAKYLARHGFDVSPGPSPLVLTAPASVATLEKTFGVRIGLYKGFYSANSDPILPANIADLMTGVFGLDNITRVRHLESPCSGPYCPQGLQVGYSFTSLYSGGFTGAGQKVAIVDEPGDPDMQTALNTFSTQYGLPATTITFQYPDGKPSSYDPTWASETAMDVEAVHAVAPGASIVLLYDSFDIMNAVDYVASNHLANVVSNSWTYECTSPTRPCSDSQLAEEQPAFIASIHSRLGVDVAQGLTILFASGDQGAQPDGTTFGPEFPASDPNVLAVGATVLTLAGCNAATCTGYGPETAAFFSGGGYSTYFAEPSWQTTTIGTRSGRAVPDVSMLGSAPGIWVYSTSSDKCLTGGNSAGWFSCTGTSLSTPLWAGFLAIVEQESGGMALGNLGPKLYQVAGSPAYSSDFHDIVTGTNGYSAATGWDPVTGWGTPISNHLASDLSVAAASSIAVGSWPIAGVPIQYNSGNGALAAKTNFTIAKSAQFTVNTLAAPNVFVSSGTVVVPCSLSPCPGNPTTYYFDHWILDGVSLGASNVTENIQVGGSQPNRIITAVYSTVPSSISTLQSGVVGASRLTIWHILPDYNAFGHTPQPKCCGVTAAELSDFTASGFLVGAESNDQYVILDTSNLIDQASGRPTGTVTKTLVTFGGPAVNQVVYYYEHSASTDASPIYFTSSNGMGQFRDRAGVVKAQIASSVAGGNSDLFLIEVFKDSAGRIVVFMYGVEWKGTYAAGLYFKSQVLPHISNFLGHWLIVSWTDASSGVSSNGIPDMAGGDTYQNIAAG